MNLSNAFVQHELWTSIIELPPRTPLWLLNGSGAAACRRASAKGVVLNTTLPDSIAQQDYAALAEKELSSNNSNQTSESNTTNKNNNNINNNNNDNKKNNNDISSSYSFDTSSEDV